MGVPKALVVRADGESWLQRGIRVLLASGCDPVLTVLGASAEAATALVRSGFPEELAEDRVRVVVADGWAEGVGGSLRAGLSAVQAVEGVSVAAITLVDLPALEAAAVRRLLSGAGPGTLRQASYDGEPGHPVIVGVEHLSDLAAAVAGDRGARPYLVQHGVDEIDCSDLGGGFDVDAPGVGAEREDLRLPPR